MSGVVLIALALGCDGGVLENPDTGLTEQTEETDAPAYQSTFWDLQLGVWVETAAPLDEAVRGIDVQSYERVLTAGGGEHVHQWSGEAWEVITAEAAPGPIGAYEATYGDVYVAVDDRLYHWIDNPGVWARWLERAPGRITGLVYSYSPGHLVSVGSQLYRITDEETWEPWAPVAPADIQCIHSTYGTQTFIAAGGTFYQLEEEPGGWSPMALPDAPEADVGGCASVRTYEDGVPVDEYLLATTRPL